MSTANEIKTSVNEKIDNARTESPKDLKISQDGPSFDNKNMEIHEELDKINILIREGTATDKDKERADNLKKSLSARKTAELELTNKDPDKNEHADDGKFEIKEGDIIDYLFKEVVLASANWAGKKVTNIAAGGLYHVAKTPYYIKDFYDSRFKKDADKLIEEKKKEEADKAKALSANQGKAKELSKIFEYYKQKNNLNIDVKEYSNNLFAMMNEGKFEDIKKLKLLPEHTVEGLQAAQAQDPNKFAENIKSPSIKSSFEDAVMLEQGYQLFAHTYANAMMLRQIREDKDYDTKNMAEDYTMYSIAGKKAFLKTMALNYKNPNRDKLMAEMFKDVQKANDYEQNSIDSKKQNVKENSHLNKVNAVFHPEVEEKAAESLRTAPKSDLKVDLIANKLNDLNKEEQYWNSRQDSNNQARDRLNKIKNKNAENAVSNNNRYIKAANQGR